MKFLVLLFFVIGQAKTQFFNNGNSGQASCLVTGNKLFSHGNYIRELRKDEFDQIKTYKQALSEFQKKLSEAFSIQNFLTNNTALTSIPTRPSLPTFCNGKETTLFILGSCTLQNHKVYINGKAARDLNDEEKIRLDEFAERLANTNYNTATSINSTDTPKTSKPIITLDDFCHEF